jgi:hypothetical protein
VKVSRYAYKPVGLLLGMAAGAVAGFAFEQVWRVIPGTGEPPHPTDRDRRVGEILAAAALQGAVFAVVRALVDRGGAHAVRRLTGNWPT